MVSAGIRDAGPLTPEAGGDAEGLPEDRFWIGNIVMAVSARPATPHRMRSPCTPRPGIGSKARPTAACPAVIRWLPGVLGALAVMRLFGGALWDWRSGARPPSSKVRWRHRCPSGTGEAGAADAERVPFYCHICGTRVGVSDRFCRRCGPRLRP